MKHNGKTMSILMVINWLEYNGVMRYLTDLSNAYVEEGNKVIVISAGGNYTNGLDKKVQHKVVESIPQTAKASIIQTAKVIEEICLKEKVDLVHCNTPTGLEAAALARKGTGVPVIFTVHSVPMWGNPIIGSEIDKKADEVITVSNFIKQHLIKTGLISSKIKLIYLGIDTKKFKERNLDSSIKASLGIKRAERVVMCVARLYVTKGIDYLIKAIPIVLEKGNNIKVVLVGDGLHRAEYEKLAKNLGVKNKVLFLGAKDKVEELLSIADIFCLPSIRDNFPFSILEAMAEGKPVIATNVGGIPELVIDKITGLLVPPKNERELALAISWLLEDGNLAKRLGSNAKNRVKEKFMFGRMFNETHSAYEKVLERKETNV